MFYPRVFKPTTPKSTNGGPRGMAFYEALKSGDSEKIEPFCQRMTHEQRKKFLPPRLATPPVSGERKFG